jgi:hypothetical protein
MTDRPPLTPVHLFLSITLHAGHPSATRSRCLASQYAVLVSESIRDRQSPVARDTSLSWPTARATSAVPTSALICFACWQPERAAALMALSGRWPTFSECVLCVQVESFLPYRQPRAIGYLLIKGSPSTFRTLFYQRRVCPSTKRVQLVAAEVKPAAEGSNEQFAGSGSVGWLPVRNERALTPAGRAVRFGGADSDAAGHLHRAAEHQLHD